MEKLAIIIPSFKARNSIRMVLTKFLPYADKIYVIDDKCPQETGSYVESLELDNVKVIYNKKNLGVGGAVKEGWKQAFCDGFDISIKVDADDQMDPNYFLSLVTPIKDGSADYTKGNRFFHLESLDSMPKIRLFGNSLLSFASKISSGYWHIMDPTNGYIAISKEAYQGIYPHKLDNGFYFESDILYQLGIASLRVKDIPMRSIYSNEVSNLKIHRILLSFPRKILKRLIKRVFYQYFLRDFNPGSVSLILGFLFSLVGVSFGLFHWYLAHGTGIPVTPGRVMIATILVIFGFQMLSYFWLYDSNRQSFFYK